MDGTFPLGVLTAFVIGGAGYALGILSSKWTLMSLKEQARVERDHQGRLFQTTTEAVEHLSATVVKIDETVGSLVSLELARMSVQPPETVAETPITMPPGPRPRIQGVQRSEPVGSLEHT